jgi:outer membrane protein assembly factor BamB
MNMQRIAFVSAVVLVSLSLLAWPVAAQTTLSGDIEINQTVSDGEQLEYEVGSDENVSDATMTLTGNDSTSDESRSWTDLEDGDSINFDVNGTKNTDLTVTLTGAGGNEGEQIWTYTKHTSGIESVAVDESTGTVFTGSQDNNIHAIDISDGSQKWTYDFGVTVTALAVDESSGIVVASESSDGKVEGININNGTNSWTYSDQTDGVLAITINESADTAFTIQNNDGDIHSIDAADGSQNWIYTGHSNGGGGDVVAGKTNGNLYSVVQYYDGSDYQSELHSISISDGSQNWAYDASTGTRYKSVAFDGTTDTVFVGHTSGTVEARDESTQNQEWEYTQHGSSIDGLVADSSGGLVYTASQDNEFHAVNINDGTQAWNYTQSSSALSSVAFDSSENVAIVGSYDGTEGSHAISTLGETLDPNVSVAGDTVSVSGSLTEGEEQSEQITDVSLGSHTGDVGVSEGVVDVDLSWTETTETVDPSIQIDSDDGSQTVDYTGTLADGSTTDLSNEIDESRIGGNVTLSVNVSESVTDGPAGQVKLNYTHTAEFSDTDQLNQFAALDEKYQPSVSNPSPDDGGALVNDTADVSALVSGGSLPIGGEVRVKIEAAGNTDLNTTITAEQRAGTQLSTVVGGRNDWTITATDNLTGDTVSKTYEFDAPGQLEVRDESQPTQLISDDNISFTARFFGTESGDVFSRDVANGTADMTGLPVDQPLIVEVSGNNSEYVGRRVLIESILQQQSIYLLPTSVPSAEVRFNINDQTGRFGDETTFFVEKPITRNNETELQTNPCGVEARRPVAN